MESSVSCSTFAIIYFYLFANLTNERNLVKIKLRKLKICKFQLRKSAGRLLKFFNELPKLFLSLDSFRGVS